jgi:hypothetical protein
MVNNGAVNVTRCTPLIPRYVALTSASPMPIPVTTPPVDTVTTFWFDESHAACVVTSCVAPSDRLAVAANWEVAPMAGDVPPTETDNTEVDVDAGVGAVGVDGEEEGVCPPHPASIPMTAAPATAGTAWRIKSLDAQFGDSATRKSTIGTPIEIFMSRAGAFSGVFPHCQSIGSI